MRIGGRCGLIVALAVAALVAAGCGSDADSPAEPPADSPAEPDTGSAEAEQSADAVRLGCPFGPFFPRSALDSPLTNVEDFDHPSVGAAVDWFLESDEGVFWPQDEWYVLHLESDRQVLFVHPGASSTGTNLSFISAELDDGSWRWAGASSPNDCDLQLEPTGSPVEWQLDPARPAAPDSTVVDVVATELSCANGEAMGDRLREPEVFETATEVRIRLSADPLLGDADCPSNPSTRVAVVLSEPLGDRLILDTRETGLGDLGTLLWHKIDAVSD